MIEKFYSIQIYLQIQIEIIHVKLQSYKNGIVVLTTEIEISRIVLQKPKGVLNIITIKPTEIWKQNWIVFLILCGGYEFEIEKCRGDPVNPWW